jgi:hypothetical protein
MKVKLRIEIEEEGSSMEWALSINDAKEPLDVDLGELIARLVLALKHRLCSPEKTLACVLSIIYDEGSDSSDEDSVALYESAKAFLGRLAKLRGRGA